MSTGATTESASQNDGATRGLPPRTKSPGSLEARTLEELCFELGLWFSGLESFLDVRNHFLSDEGKSAAARDWTREFRLTHSTLLHCSRLVNQLSAQLSAVGTPSSADASIAEIVTQDEAGDLALMLRDAILLNEGLLRATPLRFGEWSAWGNSLTEKFGNEETVGRLVRAAEKVGEAYVPEAFERLLERKTLTHSVETDIRLVLPFFGKILKWLSVVDSMLQGDEPLKPAVLIFSRINEQIHEMTGFINNRLQRFPDEDDELFGHLDAAAYSASFELKKVYQHELAGLSDIRSTPSVLARVETAYSVLNDSFQMTLINLARLIDKDILSHEVFPQLAVKMENSLQLREDLESVLLSLKAAEADPANYPIEELCEQLVRFRATSLGNLFYKDRSTLERFIEEVLAAKGKKDLVPILHAFGAYAETLLGQVKMRIVLADSTV